MASDPRLRVKNLSLSVNTGKSQVKILDQVSFEVEAEAVVALVGESGSGKSLTALSLLQLLPTPITLDSGEIWLNGRDLVTQTESQMCQIRGKELAMIFQEPMTSLNPVYSVGAQISEVLKIHKLASGRAAKARSVELLKAVGMPAAEARASAYPHELSGGMRQRAMIAMALACGPALLIADEPTTALDVTVQAQILDLLERLQHEHAMSTLFITHDLGIVAEFAAKVVVLYAGQVVEVANTVELFSAPAHPYTRGLLLSLPESVASQETRLEVAHLRPRRRLQTIAGAPYDFANPGPGCRFSERCPVYASAPDAHRRCRNEIPALVPHGGARQVRCHYPLGANGAPTKALGHD